VCGIEPEPFAEKRIIVAGIHRERTEFANLDLAGSSASRQASSTFIRDARATCQASVFFLTYPYNLGSGSAMADQRARVVLIATRTMFRSIWRTHEPYRRMQRRAYRRIAPYHKSIRSARIRAHFTTVSELCPRLFSMLPQDSLEDPDCGSVERMRCLIRAKAPPDRLPSSGPKSGTTSAPIPTTWRLFPSHGT